MWERSRLAGRRPGSGPTGRTGETTKMSDVETVSAREAVQMVLAERVMGEPGFLERLVLDPGGTVAPIVGEITQEDAEVSLEDQRVSVHIETPGHLHLVVTLDPGTDEVTGFARRPGGVGSLDMMRVRAPMVTSQATAKHTDAYLCTSSGVCPCTAEECSGGFKA